MPLSLKNFDYIKDLSFKEAPEIGMKLGEMLEGIQQQVNNIEQQTNSNANGQPSPPPALNSLKVTAQNGHFAAEINHEGAQFYRSPRYFLVHADNPHFTNPHIVDMGASRNWTANWGNVTRYFAAYASYGASPPTPMAYHGSQAQPQAVTGGGGVPAIFGTGQGSGTGAAGVAHSGVGPVPFRTKTGGPPIR